MFGSKPTTPVKRRFIGTPVKTPTKLRRLDNTQTPTKFMHSSVCPSPLRSTGVNRPPRPLGAVAKKVQKTKVASKTPKRTSARIQAKRQVLGEHNSNNTSKCSSGYNSSGSCVSSKPCSSKMSNTKCSPVSGSATSSNRDMSFGLPSSYDDFAVGLEENENCRSSVMGSRTPSIISLV